jgi:hypothetical protein
MLGKLPRNEIIIKRADEIERTHKNKGGGKRDAMTRREC